ncbi:MAG: alpha/beta hydrolase [Lachnospiraceae bacterium]|nr:alpha/beta hydrolase [Ruminococcus sp.]MCM1274452.1 alpha/beta hydrolase [Lachnospiraceae bacterium]
MKKKAFAALFAAVMLLSGCGGSPESEQSSQESFSVTSSSSSTSTTSSSSENSSSSSESSSESTSSANNASEEDKYADAPAPVPVSNTMPEDYSTEPVEFQAEIDEFYARVKEMPIPEEDKSTYNERVNGGMAIRKLEIDGTPLYEVKYNHSEPKALLFLMHAGFQQKNLEDAADMAWRAECEGHPLCVVAIDVAGCGESQDGPIQAPAAFLETVKDIDTLVEYYNTVPDVDAANFGLTGFSLGGNISLYYVIYGKYKPNAIFISGAGADPATDQGAVWDCFDKGQNGQPSVWDGDQMNSFVTAIKAIAHPEMFTDVWVYSAIGEFDEEDPQKMEAFKNAVEALGGEKFVYQCYEGLGHENPQDWRENRIKEFFPKLK